MSSYDRLMMVVRRYAQRLNVPDIFLQVHPSHAGMHEQHGFRKMGEELQACPQPPAVLLYYGVEISSVEPKHTNARANMT